MSPRAVVTSTNKLFKELPGPGAGSCSQQCGHGAEELVPGEIGQGSVPQFSSGAIARCRCSHGLDWRASSSPTPATVSMELQLERVVGLSRACGSVLRGEFEMKTFKPSSLRCIDLFSYEKKVHVAGQSFGYLPQTAVGNIFIDGQTLD